MIFDKIYSAQIAVLCVLLITSIILCVNVISKTDKNDSTAEEVRKFLEKESIKNASTEFLSFGELNLSTGIYEEGIEQRIDEICIFFKANLLITIVI
jgi:hypothetical protein